MYVRKNNCNVVTEISEKMDRELIKQNGFKNENLGECNFTIIELSKAHEIMVKDLKKNSRIIYPKKINS